MGGFVTVSAEPGEVEAMWCVFIVFIGGHKGEKESSGNRVMKGDERDVYCQPAYLHSHRVLLNGQLDIPC